jgi:hypothetical protein
MTDDIELDGPFLDQPLTARHAGDYSKYALRLRVPLDDGHTSVDVPYSALAALLTPEDVDRIERYHEMRDRFESGPDNLLRSRAISAEYTDLGDEGLEDNFDDPGAAEWPAKRSPLERDEMQRRNAED